MFRADTGLSLEAQGTQGFWARKGSLPVSPQGRNV